MLYEPLPPAEQIEITIEVEPDDLDVETHIEPAEVAQTIRERLERGDVWAWAVVTVRGSWEDGNGRMYEATDVLGGCSYESEDDFRADPYFEDMRDNVTREIRAAVDRDGLTRRIETAARDLRDRHGKPAVREAFDRVLDIYARG